MEDFHEQNQLKIHLKVKHNPLCYVERHKKKRYILIAALGETKQPVFFWLGRNLEDKGHTFVDEDVHVLARENSGSREG